jgi:ferrochelatase
MKVYDAVFFISFGGPEKREDVMPFLEIVTRGRGIPRNRLEAVAHHYDEIGGASPINAITARQAGALKNVLVAQGSNMPVYIGQRNWHPFIEDQLRRMSAEGVKRAAGFITAAHRCEASLERYVNAVEEARRNIGDAAPVIDFVGPWFDHPLFIDAIVERIRQVLPSTQDECTWIFTAHSIPCAMAKESTYVQELARTAAAVCQKLGKKKWRQAYSSRSGNPRDPWLEPDVCDAIREEARAGTQKILLIPIGFVADHVEVLFDLDVEAKTAAQEAGVTLLRAQTVGDHPLFIQMISEVLGQRMRGESAPEQRDSTLTCFQDGQKDQKVGRASGHCYCQPGSNAPPCLAQVSPKPSTEKAVLS